MVYRMWIPKGVAAGQQVRKVDWLERGKVVKERQLLPGLVVQVGIWMIQAVGIVITALVSMQNLQPHVRCATSAGEIHEC